MAALRCHSRARPSSPVSSHISASLRAAVLEPASAALSYQTLAAPASPRCSSRSVARFVAASASPVLAAASYQVTASSRLPCISCQMPRL